MTTFTVEHQAEIPEGQLLRARLKSLEVIEREFTDRKTGELKTFTKLQWLFEITQDGEYKSMTIREETNTYLSDASDNRFRELAEALLGRELDLGAVLSIDDLEGLSVLITVRYEDDRKDPKKKWRRLDDVIPLDDAHTGGEPPF